jgi:hypothetical protein
MRKLAKFKQEGVYVNPVDTKGLYAVIELLDRTVYVFDEEFIHLVRYALATSDTSEMSKEQRSLFMSYITDANSGAFTTLTRALDTALANLTLGVAYGNAATFTYAPSGVDINL